MKFSVLMSLYYKDNKEYVLQAIESVAYNQSIKPNQFVLVKDGPVGTEIDYIVQKAIEDYPEIEFTIVQLKKNCGLAKALNEGLKYCKYEWVARMDADDIACPNRFEKEINYVTKHEDVAVVGGAIKEFYNTPGDCSQIRNVPLSHIDIVKYSRKRNPMNHMTVFYKKDAVLDVGGYSINCGKLEDYRLWVDMLSKGKYFGNLEDVILYARIGNGFVERRSDKREIIDWDNLQQYMVDKSYINNYQMIMNKIYIRVFIFMPPVFKRFAYKYVLRRKKH